METLNSGRLANAGRRRHVLFCCLPQVLFVLLAAGVYLGGLWLLLPLGFLLVAVPLLDTITGWQDNQHFEKGDFTATETALLHWNTRLYVALYMAAVTYFAVTIESYSTLEIGILIG